MHCVQGFLRGLVFIFREFLVFYWFALLLSSPLSISLLNSTQGFWQICQWKRHPDAHIVTQHLVSSVKQLENEEMICINKQIDRYTILYILRTTPEYIHQQHELHVSFHLSVSRKLNFAHTIRLDTNTKISFVIFFVLIDICSMSINVFFSIFYC